MASALISGGFSQLGPMAYDDKFMTCTCGRIYRMRHFHESSLQYNEFTCACGFVLYCWHEEASYQFRLEGFQSPKPNRSPTYTA